MIIKANAGRTPVPHAAARSACGCHQSSEPEDQVRLGDFRPTPGLEHVVSGRVRPEDVDTKSERDQLREQMLSQLKAWPGATSVVTVVEDAQADSTALLVSERPKAVEQPVLEGSYEITQRLASSPMVKEMANQWPIAYHGVQPAGERTYEMKLPGSMDRGQVEEALKEGLTFNQYDMLEDLIHDLPKGKRVALLVGGPSAAGKSTLISKIREFAKDRPLSVIEGDMYFNDVDVPGYPKTTAGTHYWDNPSFMDIAGLKQDLTELLEKGEADIPVYNFMDSPPGPKRSRAPEWQIPTNVTGFREDTPHHVTAADDAIIVLDSIHATHPDIVAHFEDIGLEYRNVYLDSPSSDDRLLRRVVRDYEKRGGRSVEDSVSGWDLTTFRGEKEFIRPGIHGLDAARDVALVLQFPQDLGLTQAQIEAHGAAMKEYGLPPSYPAFETPIEQLGDFAVKEEQRLQSIVDANDDQKAVAKARRELESIRSAPRYPGNEA